MSHSSPINFAVIGAGNRGHAYGKYLQANPSRGRIVAVADPRDAYRDDLADLHGVPAQMRFSDWRQVLALTGSQSGDGGPRDRSGNGGGGARGGRSRTTRIDAVIVATPDRMHREPAEAFAKAGVHVMLEKPVSPNLADTIATLQTATRSKGVFAVCHVLLYTEYTRALKHLIDSGRIGTLTGINCVEPIGFWHFAHSYVRGNWRSESESSFSLLAKSCHDIDWFRHFMGREWESVSSFGSLAHFRPENRPDGAGDHCLSCKVEANCIFSAKRIYLSRAEAGDFEWPVNVVTSVHSVEGVKSALEHGRYGECVYGGRNDVCDNQTVNISYPGGRTVNFTMTAFTNLGPRRHQLFGTAGEIAGDGDTISLFRFDTGTYEQIDPAAYLRAADTANAAGSENHASPAKDGGTSITETTEAQSVSASAKGGHGGGDFGLMDAFIEAIERGDRSVVQSGPQQSLDSHLLVFAAEESRRGNRTIHRTEYETQNGISVGQETH